MPSVVENLTELQLTEEEAEFLVHQGFLTPQEESDWFYDTTAFIWEDLNLFGSDALDFLEAALKGFRKEG